MTAKKPGKVAAVSTDFLLADCHFITVYTSYTIKRIEDELTEQQYTEMFKRIPHMHAAHPVSALARAFR